MFLLIGGVSIVLEPVVIRLYVGVALFIYIFFFFFWLLMYAIGLFMLGGDTFILLYMFLVSLLIDLYL